MEIKEIQDKELTSTELDKLAFKVCAELGIKGDNLPSAAMIDLCLKSWQDKFSMHMNKHELALAFEANVNGDLERKVEHFQQFSRDYFCDVCNLYLKLKQQSLTRVNKMAPVMNKTERSEPEKYQVIVMQTLINDRKSIEAGQPITEGIIISERLNMLEALFEVSVFEETIAAYRKNALETILGRLYKSRQEARSLSKFGREIELTNQIARLKAQKLITEGDEALIQSEVLRLVYCNELMRWREREFVDHIESQI